MVKVLLLHMSLINSVHRGGVSASVHAGMAHPPGSRHPPGADTPGSRHPLEHTPPRADPMGSRYPLEQTPPLGADTPTQEVDSGIWSMSGWYATYWNALL